MSVLIKGMDMPKNCCECKLILWDGGAYICPFSGIMALSIGVQDDCPLVEVKTPHDTLIEEKVVRDIIDRMIFEEEADSYTLALFTTYFNHDYDLGTVIESEE